MATGTCIHVKTNILKTQMEINTRDPGVSYLQKATILRSQDRELELSLGNLETK